jgi:PelA/Pel-15E family pectate lyase
MSDRRAGGRHDKATKMPVSGQSPRFLRFVAGLGLVAGTACSSAPVPPDADAGASGTNGGVTGGTGGTAGSGGTTPAGGTGASGASGAGGSVECEPAAVPIMVPWSSINSQPAAFYASAEALTLAGNMLYYRNVDGGWPKDTDMTTRADRRSGSTIDNSATTTQIEYLSRVFNATGCTMYRDAAVGGIEYLFSGQYENGGWPQEFPNGDGYHLHITYNDNAMVRVLTLIRNVGLRAAPYEYLDESFVPRAEDSVARGISCILETEVVSDTQAGWCAQHDEMTLLPAQARSYELPSLSGSEGVGIVRFLMTIDNPSPEVREAIEGAVAWFEAVKIEGIRVMEVADANQPSGEDVVVVEDPAAPPIWARFYELETNRPIFSSRCEVDECDADPYFMVRYSLAEIDNERRTGYAWYGDWPHRLLTADYPAWQAKWPE